MYQRILVASGGSPWSDAAVSYATAIAARTGADLHILTVLINPAVYTTMDVMGGSDVVTEVIEREGQALLEQAAFEAQQAGVRCKTESRWGSIPEAILHTAEDIACDLIVLGARRVTGWKRLRLGNIANAVAVKARQPVLVVKQPPAVTPGSPLGRRLLVATGGSPWSDIAVDYAHFARPGRTPKPVLSACVTQTNAQAPRHGRHGWTPNLSSGRNPSGRCRRFSDHATRIR